MGFFNDIITDARPAPASTRESLNTELQHSGRPFDEELRPGLPGPLPGPVDYGGDSSVRREVKGEVSSSRVMASEPPAIGQDQNGSTSQREKPAGESLLGAPARGVPVESRQLNGDDENEGPIRERMPDPPSVSLKGDGLSTRLPDRDAVAATVVPKTGSVSERTAIEGQTSDPWPEPGPVENLPEVMAKNTAVRKPRPEAVEQANGREFSLETRVESSAESPRLREDQIGFEGAPPGPWDEVEPRHQEPSRDYRAVMVEIPVEEEKDLAVPGTAMTQPPLAEERPSQPSTSSTGGEQVEQQDSSTLAAAFRETAVASSPDEGEIPEPMGLEQPSQPQVSIGRIEVIVEVSDSPAAEKAVKSGAPSQALSSRYYLRRL